MTAEQPRRWGAGRVAFVARLDTIKGDLQAGRPLTEIYAQQKEALGVGYASFCKLVARYAQDAKLTPQRPRAGRAPADVAAPAPPAASQPTPPKPAPLTQGSPHARHTPAGPARRTLSYDPVVRKTDIERLVGPAIKEGGDPKE